MHLCAPKRSERLGGLGGEAPQEKKLQFFQSFQALMQPCAPRSWGLGGEVTPEENVSRSEQQKSIIQERVRHLIALQMLDKVKSSYLIITKHFVFGALIQYCAPLCIQGYYPLFGI